MEFDWFRSTVEARRALYDVSKRAVFERFQGDWNAFLAEALSNKASVGAGYIDNFRAGRISRVRSAAIARWLDENEPALAAELKSRLALIDDGAASAWTALLDQQAIDNRLAIIRFDQLGIVGLARDQDGSIATLKRGEEFCLKLDSQREGAAIGLQRAGALWFPLPLSDDALHAQVALGKQLLPRSTSGDVIPLSEEEDAGHVEFVIAVCSADCALDVDGWIAGQPVDVERLAQDLRRRMAEIALDRVNAIII